MLFFSIFFLFNFDFLTDESKGKRECWICYDDETSEQLIQPCDCKGGTKYVHHECLKKWLMEVNKILYKNCKNIKEFISDDIFYQCAHNQGEPYFIWNFLNQSVAWKPLESPNFFQV